MATSSIPTVTAPRPYSPHKTGRIIRYSKTPLPANILEKFSHRSGAGALGNKNLDGQGSGEKECDESSRGFGVGLGFGPGLCPSPGDTQSQKDNFLRKSDEEVALLSPDAQLEYALQLSAYEINSRIARNVGVASLSSKQVLPSPAFSYDGPVDRPAGDDLSIFEETEITRDGDLLLSTFTAMHVSRKLQPPVFASIGTQTDEDAASDGVSPALDFASVPSMLSDVLLLPTADLCEFANRQKGAESARREWELDTDEYDLPVFTLEDVEARRAVLISQGSMCADQGCQTVDLFEPLRKRMEDDIMALLGESLKEIARKIRGCVARVKRWEDAWRSGASFSCEICLQGSDSDGEAESPGDESCDYQSASSKHPPIAYPPPDMRKFIDRTAEFVVQWYGDRDRAVVWDRFEAVKRELEGKEYQFLFAEHQFRPYYDMRVRLQQLKAGASAACALDPKKEVEEKEVEDHALPTADDRLIQLTECDCVVKICAGCLAEKEEMVRASEYDIKKCSVCRKPVPEIKGVPIAMLRGLDEEVRLSFPCTSKTQTSGVSVVVTSVFGMGRYV